ncbi:short-chain dehydrogenase [Diplodia corticola]|uniref:Short-chain dehydrogenase n=1 Tax=Diplodia corticola TaxID=236234 RepID=A0A1J9S2Y7_9PEZI|nr:short-chain dehydrogenase [Diplodia corticola]OJD33997.1 short-chain dehydrogenase [Diplodia corticola]
MSSSPSSPSFANKTIAITGAASGIGLALAHLLASRGAALALADVNGAALTAATASIRQSHPTARILVATALDVRDRAAVARWIREAADQQPLTGAANIAGIINSGLNVEDVEETSDGEWERVLGVNLTGAMVCLSEEVREMKRWTREEREKKEKKEEKELRNGGGDVAAAAAAAGAGGVTGGFSIVNTASIVGIKGGARCSAYAASKAGVIALTKSVARETGEWGIRVNAVAPGVILTPLTGLDTSGAKEGQQEWNKLAPLGRAGQPEEVAEVIAWLLSDNSSYVTGMVHEVDGGILA